MSKLKVKDIKESDLYEPVRDYLANLGYEVNGEIHSCDLVAKKDQELLVVELKKQLNLEVILQAVERQKIAETVYIAAFKPEKFSRSSKYKKICHLLRRLEIGLMLLSCTSGEWRVEVVQAADYFDRYKSQVQNRKKRNQIEKEFANRKTKTTGGIVKTKVMTAYREQAMLIAKEVETFENFSPKDLKHLEIPLAKIQKILYDNHYGWFIRVDRGIYKISDRWFKNSAREL